MINFAKLGRHFYCMLIGFSAVIVFICTFFPITGRIGLHATFDNIPSHIERARINVSDVYHSHVGRIVIMIIDAFRVDFIEGFNGSVNMPYTHSLLKEGRAFSVVGQVQTPTVTMPRIKAMTTGTVPSFIDIVYNLGSNSIAEDNFIQQAESNGRPVIFYGDETWLKLFPSNFKRKEGTTSFFVTDFVEVDNNVTRHLENELEAIDWTVMILHYLGLDHIGHLEGPRSSHVKPKLQEMDSVVQQIHQSMMEWTLKTSQQHLLIVCGDHGMKDSGGHGGASAAETAVPIVAVGLNRPPDVRSKQKEVSQIDLVPTLSTLLGVPIPEGNIGKIIPQFLETLPVNKKLFALFYNAQQVAIHYQQMSFYESKEPYLVLQEAMRLHTLWLESNSEATHLAVRAEELYMSCLKNMSEELKNSKVSYDVFILYTVIFIELQICIILLFQNRYNKISVVQICQLMILSFVLLCLDVLYCLSTESDSAFCSTTLKSIVFILVIIFIIAQNCIMIVNSCTTVIFRQTDMNSGLWWFLLGSGVHLVSLLSSSFIEEEHQVWYFAWLTFLLVVLFNQCQLSYHSGFLKYSTIFQSISLAITHRVLRKLNQTGDKWAALPDISDWLLEPFNKGNLSFVLVSGLAGNCACLLYWKSVLSDQSITIKVVDFLLCAFSLWTVYLYRAATGAVLKLFASPETKGFEEINVFWCLLFILTAKQLLLSLSRRDYRKISVIGDLINLCLVLWILMTSLLHRPYNVLLPGAQAWASSFLSALYQQTHKTRDDTRWLTLAHFWLGMVFYFYQGNSNSLATIDVAAGYVGLQDYSPVLVGFFLVVNTFAAPMLSLLLLVAQLFLEARKRGIYWFLDHVGVAFHTLISYRQCIVTLYLVLLTFQRYHLFVWTVFSPKLLYESSYTLIQYVFIVCMYGILVAVIKWPFSLTSKSNKNF